MRWAGVTDTNRDRRHSRSFTNLKRLTLRTPASPLQRWRLLSGTHLNEKVIGEGDIEVPNRALNDTE